MIQYAKQHFNWKNITAHVFSENIGSQKVLLKNGFAQAAQYPNYYNKDGKLYDAILYKKTLPI